MENIEIQPVQPREEDDVDFFEEKNPSRREEAAKKIKAQRREYFESKKNIDKEIEYLEVQVKEIEQEIARITQEIEEMDKKISAMEKSRIKNYFKIRKLKEQKSHKEISKIQHEDFSKNFKSVIQLINEQRPNKGELVKKAKKILDKFRDNVVRYS